MEYFKIADKYYDRLTHYKDRTPPWIKIHNDFLEDYQFSKLPDQKKYHFIASMLLASRSSNKIVHDSEWVRQKINANSKVDLDLFLEKGFIEKTLSENKELDTTLAECKQDASKVVAQNRIEENRIEENRGEGEGENANPPTEILFEILTAENKYLNLNRGAVDAYVNRFPNLNVSDSLAKMEGRYKALPPERRWRYCDVLVKVNNWLADDAKGVAV